MSPIWIALVGVLPWVVLLGVLAFGIHRPRDLPRYGASAGAEPSSEGRPAPRVRVVIPARNEVRNIEACLRSLAAQEYASFLIVVVDDRSTDGTARLANQVPAGHSDGIRVVEGEPLPEGWFGKPWACWQGAAGAEEELLLFSDADTRHAPDLLARVVAASEEDRADAVTLLGHQELGSFWERLVQPQVLTLLALRYRHLSRPLEKADAQDAIANGQYILVRREAYARIDGHRTVRHEVAEDLRLAQLLTGAGLRLSVRSAEDSFSTRMYQSLREIVDGWTKNVSVGARQSAGWWGAVAVPGIVLFQVLFWILPVGVLLALLARTLLLGDPLAPVTPALTWSGGATAVGLLTWAAVYNQFQVPVRYAWMFPIGAGLVAWIALRSGLRGRRRIEWKGRLYSPGRADGPEDD